MSYNMYTYNVRLLKVVDGDTVDFIIDLGFSVSTKQRFRLWGINAPESRTRDKDEKVKGLKSKKWLKQKLKAMKNIQIVTHKNAKGKDAKGKFGRYLAQILDSDPSVDKTLNEQMVDKGLAVEFMKESRTFYHVSDK